MISILIQKNCMKIFTKCFMMPALKLRHFGTLPAQYAEYPDVYIPATPALVERAVQIAPALRRVTCASADKFVDGPEAKSALHERFGADICEMEAAGVVLSCNRAGVPCLVIKTVSDGITGGAEEFSKELTRSAEICLSITDEIIRAL